MPLFLYVTSVLVTQCHNPIQQAAQQAERSIDTLLYYERIGLITGVERNGRGV